MQIPLKVHVWNPLRKSKSIFLLNGSFKSGILMTVNRIGWQQLKGTFSFVLARATFLYYFFVKIFFDGSGREVEDETKQVFGQGWGRM